jgi:hypothetical protein
MMPSAVMLLPTPTARDGKGANQRGDATCLHGALLPTPQAADANGHHSRSRQDSRGGELLLPGVLRSLADGGDGLPQSNGGKGSPDRRPTQLSPPGEVEAGQ